MSTIQRLVVQLGANAQNLITELTSGRKNLRKFAKEAVDTGKQVSLALAGIATGVGIGVVAIVERQAAQIDALAKKADKLGLGTVALQKLEYQAEMTGISQNTLGTALQRMTRRVAEAAQGTGEAKKAIAELGLSAEELSGMSPDQQFYAIADAMKGVAKQGDKVRLAMRIFDTEGVGLVNTFAADLKALGAEFDALGVGITRQQAAAVEAYNDSKSKLATIFGGFFNNVTAEVAPAFKLIIDKISETIQEMGGVRTVAQSFARGVISVIRGMVNGAASGLKALGNIEIGWKKIQMAIIAVGEAATDVLNMLTPSVWAQKFGIDFNDTSIQKFNKELAGTGEQLASEILKLQQEMAEGPAFQVKAQQLLDELDRSIGDIEVGKNSVVVKEGGAAQELDQITQWRQEIAALQQQIMDSPGQNVAPMLAEIAALKEKIANSTDPMVGSNDKNTGALNKNTLAVLASGKGKVDQADLDKLGDKKKLNPTEGGKKNDPIWDRYLQRTMSIIGTSQAHSSDAEVFKRGAMAQIAMLEARGGFDTNHMKAQMDELLSRMGADVGTAVKTAMGGDASAQSKSMGTLTLVLRDKDGTTEGVVSGPRDLLQGLTDLLGRAALQVAK